VVATTIRDLASGRVTSHVHAVASTFFNPTVIRHLKRAQEDLEAGRLRDSLTRKAVAQSETFLRALAKKAHKMRGNNVRRGILVTKQDTFDGVLSLERDAELQACAAASIILLPESSDTWRRLDATFARTIERRAAWGDFESFEVPLLCSYAVLVACEERGFDATLFKTPSLVMRLLSDKCDVENTLDSIFPTPTADSELDSSSQSSAAAAAAAIAPLLETHGSSGLETPIGGGGTLLPSSPPSSASASDSSDVAEFIGTADAALSALATPNYDVDEVLTLEALDQIAICMYVMAKTRPRASRDSNKLLLSLVSHNCSRALEALRGAARPVELGALRYIWESAADLPLPNAYGLYKALYEAALASVQANPLQVAHREEALTSLLESMVKSRFKNSKLVGEVGAAIQAKGSSFEHSHCGARLFNALVSLNAMGLALQLLDQMMRSMAETPQTNRVLYGSTFGAGRGGHSFLSLSEEGRLRIEDFLESQGAHSTTGLMLALHCFSREERGSRYYQLLESMEAPVPSRVPDMTMHEVLNTLHTYGSVTRNQPLVLSALSKRVDAGLEGMNKMELQTALWALARLNLRPPYVPRAADLFFRHFGPAAGVRTLSVTGYRQVVMTLWSLAVLQSLSVEQYLTVEPLLLDAFARRQGRTTSPIEPALVQVLVELRYGRRQGQGKGQGPVATLSPADAAVAAALGGLAVPTVLAPVTAETGQEWHLRPWEQPPPNSSSSSPAAPAHSAHIKSSASHLKLSHILSLMGVSHINEADVGHGYIVDILVPGRVPGGPNGTVIEVDGPYHFESFMQQPVGPTVMKRRHLRALGFLPISIPYTAWSRYHKDQAKLRAMLRQYLDAAESGAAADSSYSL